MDKYYNIAGFLICITGEESEAVHRIHSFEPFEVKAGKPYFTLRLVSQANEKALTEEESALLYNIECESIACRFTRLANYSYRLSMKSSESDEPLLLHYRPGSRECLLAGVMNPNLLRFALWTTFGMLTAGQAIAIHASAVVFNGKAVIFLGESGTGKSTHAQLWQEYIDNVALLSDDSPIIRMDGSLPYICSSPWSGKMPCFRNERFPLVGIIRLSQAENNQIRRLWMLEAISAIFPSCPPVFVKDGELSSLIYDTISEVLARVPVWHLECLPNEAAARLSYETVSHAIEENNTRFPFTHQL